MPGNDAISHENPMAVPSARRLSLVVGAGTKDERLVACRRVVTLIGSRDGCKIVLNHPRVAPVHVALINEGSRVVAVDLVTKHGTLLNGLSLQHEKLSDGDVITVQKWDFGVRIEEPVMDDHADVHPFPLDESPRVTLEHAGTKKLFQPKREVCTIGRRPGCDIVLSDPDVSRVHAILLTYFGQPALFDLLSRNRTFVNDQAVQFKLLSHEDQVSVGAEHFHVRFAVKTNGAVVPREEPAQERSGQPRSVDLIDIRSTEGSQRWRIADKLDKLAKPRPAAT